MMLKPREPHNSQWVIVTFKRPVMWTRNEDEVWVFNPPGRYVLNANQLGNLSQYIQSISDLKNSKHYKPLLAGPNVNLRGASVLIERYRERGIGDLLFLTGPMNYLRFLSGNEVGIDMYALSDRGLILNGHPALRYGSTMAGALPYDFLQGYDYHWFVDTATEYDEEPDQLNVYDCLFKNLGLDPDVVPIEYKRPSVNLTEEDFKHLDAFLYFVWLEKKLDLRKTGYYVVAPFARGSLRSMPYGTWLQVIRQLANKRPVIVVGGINDRMPETDMSAGEFNEHVTQSGGNVINAIGKTPLRVLMTLIAKAQGLGCMDSGPLYLAEAVRTPAVSVWGPHDPRVRIGYDKDYMDLAVWKQAACRHSPCYAYDWFPPHKCPNGEAQKICEVLAATSAEDILLKFEEIETRSAPLGALKPGTPNG